MVASVGADIVAAIFAELHPARQMISIKPKKKVKRFLIAVHPLFDINFAAKIPPLQPDVTQ